MGMYHINQCVESPVNFRVPTTQLGIEIGESEFKNRRVSWWQWFHEILIAPIERCHWVKTVL